MGDGHPRILAGNNEDAAFLVKPAIVVLDQNAEGLFQRDILEGEFHRFVELSPEEKVDTSHLADLVESLVVLAPEETVRPEDLPPEYRVPEGTRPGEGEGGEAPSVPSGDRLDVGGGMTMDEIERLAILSALEKTGGNRTQAAELLGIGLRTLQRKLKEYRLAGKAEGI